MAIVTAVGISVNQQLGSVFTSAERARIEAAMKAVVHACRDEGLDLNADVVRERMRAAYDVELAAIVGDRAPD